MVKINPIIPIWAMAIICILLLLLKRKGIWPYIRQIILVLLLFVINLRIMLPVEDTVVTEVDRNLNVLFVIDNTISMAAGDVGDGTRLDAAKADCEHIIDELYGSKFAAISFNNNSNFIAPFSDNASHTKSVINALCPPDDYYAKGSSLNTPKAMMESTLKDIYEKENGNIIVFFLSDGEITNGETLESFKSLSQYISGGAVLGYGTAAGAKMYVKDSYTDEYYYVMDKTDYPYTEAVSKIDESNLKALASDLGVDYINAGTSGGKIDEIIRNAKANATEEETKVKTTDYVDIYYYFVIPVILLLIYEVIDLRRRVYI